MAYDLSETAEVVCKIQAYPKPEFKWYYESNTAPLLSSSEGHYVIATSVDDNDVYTSVLKIANIKSNDYGRYRCQVVNNLGNIEEEIKLQSKGPPDQPTRLNAIYMGHNYVTLNWEPGFNGGMSNTKYFVSFKKNNVRDPYEVEGCGVVTKASDWLEVDCQQSIPCNVSHLDQHQTYLFKVKAFNAKGVSAYSREIEAFTRVDKLPEPQRVGYDPSSQTLFINIPRTCLPLIAVVESSTDTSPMQTWKDEHKFSLQVSGLDPTYKEVRLDQKDLGRSSVDEPIGVNDEYPVRVRVKLCLSTQPEHCGQYINADCKFYTDIVIERTLKSFFSSFLVGPAYVKEAAALATPTLIAIVVSCIVFVLFVGLLLMFCRCKRNQSKKSEAKDYEMDSVRPTIVSQQNQAPPPYYPSTGMDNKALEHSLDLALALEDQKSAVYATQNGYGYHVSNNDLQSRQNINNTECK